MWSTADVIGLDHINENLGSSRSPLVYLVSQHCVEYATVGFYTGQQCYLSAHIIKMWF